MDEFTMPERDVVFRAELVKIKLGEHLVELMRKHKKTAAQIEKKLNWPKGFVTDLLKCEVNPTLETLVELGLFFGCELDLSFRELP